MASEQAIYPATSPLFDRCLMDEQHIRELLDELSYADVSDVRYLAMYKNAAVQQHGIDTKINGRAHRLTNQKWRSFYPFDWGELFQHKYVLPFFVT
jgi:hypothetical protein